MTAGGAPTIDAADARDLGAIAAADADPARGHEHTELAIHLSPHAADGIPQFSRNQGCLVARRAAVLFGGCGDARLFFSTLTETVGIRTAEQLRGVELRATMNDISAEQVTRFYILCVLLRRAGAALPAAAADAAATLADQLSTDAQRRLLLFWHVWHAPNLPRPFYDELVALLCETAAAAAPALGFVRCTAGTWAQIREVCRLWADVFDMSAKEEAQGGDAAKAQSDAFVASGEAGHGPLQVVWLLHGVLGLLPRLCICLDLAEIGCASCC